MVEMLLEPLRGGPKLSVPPLSFNIPQKVRAAAREKIEAAGASPGNYTLVHGIESTSAASMRSQGDPDSALSLPVLEAISKEIR